MEARNCNLDLFIIPYYSLITENMILAEKLGREQSHLTVDMVALAFHKMDLMEDLRRKPVAMLPSSWPCW
jgi:hypothetical protein